MFFTKSRLKQNTHTYDSVAKNCLNESVDKYDIFLSHSYEDKEYIAELKSILECYGFTVYVDWITDADILNRNIISKDTAEQIRTRIKQSECMIFATSLHSPNSKWMPWELGYFDGLKNSKIAILPITDYECQDFKGQEYLSLYPYISEDCIKGKNEKTLWVNETKNKYVTFEKWLRKNKKPCDQ